MDIFNWIQNHVLILLIIVPFLSALALALPIFNKIHDPTTSRAQNFGALTAIIGGFLLLATKVSRLQENYVWFKDLGIHCELVLDGFSFVLIVLTLIIFPIAIIQNGGIRKSVRGYTALMLCTEGAVIGTLLSTDLMLFYVFWELMLIPMYFIIGIWGGSARIHATFKFVLITMCGSFLMLLGIIYLSYLYYQQSGVLSFSLNNFLNTKLSISQEFILFSFFALAFAVKIPIIPLHTWLPDAHVEAPTGGSVVLAAILLKLGVYGFLRFVFPLFPHASFELFPVFAILGVTAVIYASYVAFAQNDLKKMIAYSSIAHLGYCVFGLATLSSVSISGVYIQMLSHGFVSAALFIAAGGIYYRCQTRDINQLSGLASKMPICMTILFFFSLAAIALPATSGFVGEFMILSSSFENYPILTLLALLGVILSAVYMLNMYKRISSGQREGNFKDYTSIDTVVFLPLIFFVLIIGIYPQIFLKHITPEAERLVRLVRIRQVMFESNESENSQSIDDPSLRVHYLEGLK